MAFQDTFTTLCLGDTLVLPDEWVRRDVRALAELMRQQSIDRLFVPQLHTVSLTALGPGAFLVGGALSGGDRLGFQRWAVAAYWQPNSDDVSVLINQVAAPPRVPGALPHHL